MRNSLNLPTIPAFALPPLIARLGARLPQWPHSVSLVLALNAARKLGVLPDETLQQIEGRSFRVTVADTGMVADFAYNGGSFRRIFITLDKPDLHFTARLSAFLQLVSRQEDPDTLFFNRSLTVEGDTELGLRVKNMLDALEWPQLSLQGLR
jgi:O2-independent ubiquinone biosynthesis accessory factor UbiT